MGLRGVATPGTHSPTLDFARAGDPHAARPEKRPSPFRDGQRAIRLTRIHVLLDDREQVGIQLRRGLQHRPQRRHPRGRLAHHTPRDGRPERHLVRPDVRQDLRVHLLEVEVPDPLTVGLDQLDAVAAAVRVVPGVQTQGHLVGVRAVEEADYVLLAVDVGVGVRVDDDLQAVPLPHLLAETFGQRGEIAPLLGREGVRFQHLAGLVVPPEGRDDHQVGRAHRLGQHRVVRDVRPGLLPDGLAVVQAGEHRAGRDLQAAARGLLGEDRRIGREVPVRAQLDPLVAGGGDLVEEALPGDLLGIVREPDAPGVGCRADADAGDTGRWGLR